MSEKKPNIWKRMINNKKSRIIIIILLIIIVILGCVGGYLTSSKTNNQEDTVVFIYPKDNFQTLKTQLIEKNIISKNNTSLETFANLLKYKNNIKPGRYVVEPHTSILSLVRQLRNRNQTPIKLVILSARTAEEFAEKISKNLLLNKEDIIKQIKEENYKYSNEIFYHIIPNTYEVYWTISAEQLLNLLKKESDKFWQENKEKLSRTSLTKEEVIRIASIVSEETSKTDEMPTIAGVYINRLRKDMLLQADPTVKFTTGDFALKRITGKHLQIDSPFNTYKYKGLPPAPICLPNIQAIQSVLKYKHHNYLYFCAKEDFSGYHNFASTLEEHQQNGRRYRMELNRRGIK